MCVPEKKVYAAVDQEIETDFWSSVSVFVIQGLHAEVDENRLAITDRDVSVETGTPAGVAGGTIASNLHAQSVAKRVILI